jgi:hypothetical protein
MTNPYGLIFSDGSYLSDGLTKREYFAAMAIQVRCFLPNPRLTSDYVKEAVEMADMLIAELNKSIKEIK